MAGSVNKVILVGNLGADPELRYTQGGQSVANLRVATREVWNDREGQRQERTEWHNVTVWGRVADNCAQYLSKGRQVYVEGRLQSREYTDRDGNNRRVWDVVANQIQFLSGGEGGRRSGGWQDGDQAGASSGACLSSSTRKPSASIACQVSLCIPVLRVLSCRRSKTTPEGPKLGRGVLRDLG